MVPEHNTEPGRLRFGTVDWRHPEWLSAYYPDDLPEDWQLGYYANELAAVLLAPAGWCGEDAAQLQCWAEEVDPAFRFYLLADAAVDANAQRQLAMSLGGRLGGLLWPTPAAPAGVLTPLSGLPERIRAWGDDGGLRLALLDVAGLDLRARRVLLEWLTALWPASGDVAVILDDTAGTPSSARELAVVAELLGLA